MVLLCYMELHDICSRQDVFNLVITFYAKVRDDELLGPIFNGNISDWDEHFVKLTDFWESNLFFQKKYQGDPLEKHIEVDRNEKGKINEMHFGVWLNLWYQTIDELFVGETANIAKNRARNMGTYIHLSIFGARQNTGKKL